MLKRAIGFIITVFFLLNFAFASEIPIYDIGYIKGAIEDALYNQEVKRALEEGRKKFISENLPELTTAINDTYGPILVEELLRRIEFTIKEFNSEINDAFSLLKDKDIKRKEAYSNISSSNIDLSKNEKTE